MKQASSSSMLRIPVFLLFKLCLIYLILVDTLHKTMILRHYCLKHFSLLYICDYWFASLLWYVYCTKLKGTANRFMEVDNVFVTVWHCCWCDVSCYSFLVYFYIYYVEILNWFKFMILFTKLFHWMLSNFIRY